MNRKTILLLTAVVVFMNPGFTQESSVSQQVLRMNVMNPGIEYEIPLFSQSTLAVNLGVGYGGSHPNLTTNASGWLYLIAPFADIHFRNYYNFNNRLDKGKNIQYNAGNFLGVRMLVRGKTLSSNFTRTSNYDFAIGPAWGVQRSFRRINLLIDLGFAYYFDTRGNDGFTPMLELNLGYNLRFW
ncbi:MAG: hypothetical protein V2I54_04700 [Bacteroidales bacterium]|jgi:hypothetical protein|nr:hypothetical protein [Bacteroidales bacterium]